MNKPEDGVLHHRAVLLELLHRLVEGGLPLGRIERAVAVGVEATEHELPQLPLDLAPLLLHLTKSLGSLLVIEPAVAVFVEALHRLVLEPVGGLAEEPPEALPGRFCVGLGGGGEGQGERRHKRDQEGERAGHERSLRGRKGGSSAYRPSPGPDTPETGWRVLPGSVFSWGAIMAIE